LSIGVQSNNLLRDTTHGIDIIMQLTSPICRLRSCKIFMTAKVSPLYQQPHLARSAAELQVQIEERAHA
jgi:hypothetical protein